MKIEIEVKPRKGSEGATLHFFIDEVGPEAEVGVGIEMGIKPDKKYRWLGAISLKELKHFGKAVDGL